MINSTFGRDGFSFSAACTISNGLRINNEIPLLKYFNVLDLVYSQPDLFFFK